MGQINGHTDLSNIKDTTDFIRFASALISNICDVVNGNVQFDSNFKSQTVSVTFPAGATDVSVQHNLNKTGVNYLAARKSAPCDVYTGSGAATNNTVVLRGTAASTVILVLY